MNNDNKLLKNSIIYAIGQVISQALNFFLLPIYTNKLGTEDYGKYATITSFTGFVSMFLILSIYSGFYRFYKECKGNNEQENKMINTALNFAYLMSFFIVILLIIIGKPISQLIFRFDNGYKILCILIITSIISQISSIYTSKYSLEYKALKVSMINIIKYLIQAIFIILLVVYKNEGIIGILYGQLISNILIYLYLIIIEYKNYKFEICINMLRNMMICSVGLLPVNVSGWILQLSDRYFLSTYRDFEITGIYNLGYQFGMLINPIFITPFMGSFMPYAFETYKNDNAKENFKLFMRNYNVIGCFIMICISIFAKSGIYLFANKNFLSAYSIVPMVVYSYFLYGKLFYYALGLQIKNKTYLEGIYMILSAGINIGLNFIVVPKFGMMGAAISTIISYLILNFILIYSSQKEYKINLDLRFIISVQVITLIFYLIYLIYSYFATDICIEILCNIILTLVYIFVLFKFRFIDFNNIIYGIKNKIKY